MSDKIVEEKLVQIRSAELQNEIDERKRVEEALRKSEARYREMLENVNDIIYTHDLQGNFTSINRSGERISGYTRDEILTMNIVDIVAPDNHKLVQDMLQHKLKDQKSDTNYELDIITKAGNRLTLEVNSRLIYHNEQAIEVQGIARDITERCQAENRDKELQERTQRQERLATIGQLATGIAHDFNNMLTGIIGYAELIYINPSLPDHLQHDIKIISQQGKHAARLIRQILNFSRKSAIQKYPLDLYSFLKETIKMLRRTLPENIAITIETPRDQYIVNANLTQIQQIITNLAVNARDAMSEYGGKLCFHLSHYSFQSEDSMLFPEMESGSWVVISVSDTGIGIPSEVLPHIYESFYTTKDVGKGTGLGLSQVHEIIRRHDGFIDVESEVGKGTTFFIYLPEWDEDTHLVYRRRETIPRGQDEIILLVEDESMVRAVARRMLSDLGYEVFATSNGQEALEIYKQHRDAITLVLSDMVMPQMGGIELYRLLCKSNPSIKMVLMSGYPPDEDNQELLDQKTVGWIQKPLSFKQLAQIVRETIEG